MKGILEAKVNSDLLNVMGVLETLTLSIRYDLFSNTKSLLTQSHFGTIFQPIVKAMSEQKGISRIDNLPIRPFFHSHTIVRTSHRQQSHSHT